MFLSDFSNWKNHDCYVVVYYVGYELCVAI